MTKQSKKPVHSGNTMLMTAKQMSAVSGIGENTIRRLMECGELEYLQIGNVNQELREQRKPLVP